MKPQAPHPHRRARRFLIAAATLSALMVLMAWLNRPVHTYQGKTLTEWLDSPTLMITNWLAYNSDRFTAFQGAGAEGVKLLLKELEAVDSKWNWQIAQLAEYPLLRNWTEGLSIRSRVNPSTRSLEAGEVLLGLWAYPDNSLKLFVRSFERAASGLTDTNHPHVSAPMSLDAYCSSRLFYLASCLVRMGDPGLDYLTNQLVQARDPRLKLGVLRAFSRAAINASRAVPVVAAVAAEPGLSGDAQLALANIRGDPMLTIPVLIPAATNGHWWAITALGEYGPTVRPWLPQLSALTNHPDATVRFQWDIAERKITGR